MEESASESTLTGKMEFELELLQRHLDILKTVNEHGPLGIIRLAELTGFPQHKVRYSLRILEADGLIEPSAQGAIATGRLHEFIPQLRHVLALLTTSVSDIRAAIGEADEIGAS